MREHEAEGGRVPDTAITSARTFLFVPGDRPDRFASAAGSGADVVVLDLEDSVAPGSKDDARVAVAAWLATRPQVPVMVRVNPVATPWHADDVAWLRSIDAAVMLPKVEDPAAVVGVLAAVGLRPLVALVETPRGVLDAGTVARVEGVTRLAFGHIDLAAALGVDPTSRDAFLHARSTLVLASAAAGLAPPVDGVTTALDDDGDVLAADVRHAVELGLEAKLCIHPRQVATAHAALAPSEADLAWARTVVEQAGDGGATTLDGEMVDLPVLLRARRVVARASRG